MHQKTIIFNKMCLFCLWEVCKKSWYTSFLGAPPADVFPHQNKCTATYIHRDSLDHHCGWHASETQSERWM